MILDKNTLWADSLAYGGTPEVLDLGNAAPGPGQPIKCFFTTESALTGCTGVVFLDDADGNADEPLFTLDPSVFAAVGTHEFYLPSMTQQHITLALEGTVSAGVFSAGIVMDAQTNT